MLPRPVRNPLASAFTLVEAIVASLLVSLVFILAWNMYTTASRSAEVATWHTKYEQQLRNGLRLLRDDIGHASYPSTVGPASVAITQAGHGFRFHKGRVDLTGTSGTVPLLDFYICKPAKSGFGPPEDDPGEQVHATLEARLPGVVWYKKSGNKNPDLDRDKMLFDSGGYIEIDGPDSSPAEKATTCAIEVKSVHPDWKQRGVVERTSPKIEVDVASNL